MLRSILSPSRSAWVPVVAVAAGLLVGAGPAAATTPATAPGAAPATAPAVAAPAAAGRVDPNDRASVVAGYQQTWVPDQSVPAGWTGSTASCAVGTDSAAGQRATLDSINYARALVRQPALALDAGLSAQALPAALMQDANNSLSHTPPTTWACYSDTGAQASGRSNLALFSPSITPGRAIGAYLTDSGTGNEVVGHRRWILFSRQTTVGSGTTARANALYVLDTGSWRATPAGRGYTAWPSAGYFPGQLEPAGRWSFSVPGADFSQASVTVARGRTVLPTTVISRTDNGFGDNTLVWSVAPGWSAAAGDVAYTVTVSGYRTAAGATTTTRYRTTLVDAAG